MSSSKLLSSSGTESQTERMTPVVYGRNSMSDLDSCNDTATNDVDGRIGSKTWCKCECCAPLETSIKSVCCLEIPGSYKP